MIVGHVDFGLFEVIVRVTGWVHSGVVDFLLYGFPPVKVIPWCGCHRPIEPDPPPAQLTLSRAWRSPHGRRAPLARPHEPRA